MEIVFHITVGSWIFVTLIKADCAYPGLPKNGYGRQIINGASKDIEWDTEFAEDAVVLYGCTDGFKMKMFEDRQITCTGGQWNGLVPKCYKQIDNSNLDVECFTKTKSGDIMKGNRLKCNDEQYSHVTLNTLKTHKDLQVRDIIEIQTQLCPGSTGSLRVVLNSLDGNKFVCLSVHKNETAEVFKCNHSVDKHLTSVVIDISDNPMSFNQVVLLVRSDDYCGLPAVPPHSKVEMVSATEYKFECVEGYSPSVTSTVTCNPTTGEWSPPPTCTEIFPAWKTTLIVIGIVMIILVFGFVCIIVCWKRLPNWFQEKIPEPINRVCQDLYRLLYEKSPADNE